MSAGVTLEQGLAHALARIGMAAPAGLERLSGGANMESWRFSAGSEPCILRRSPAGGQMIGGRSITYHTEAELIRAACKAGVMAPEVLVELDESDGIGAGFIMRAIPGTPDPAVILGFDNPQDLIADIGREMAATHRAEVSGLADLPVMETVEAIAQMRERYMSYGGDRPILSLALRWLEANVPPAVPPRLVHGDFRMGNLLIGTEGETTGRLTGVLDWELAHLGDPHEDLAYGCMTVWRFARPDRPAFGVGAVEDLARAYEAAGGEAFDPVRFRFWLVYRTFWWALGCMQMGNTWRSGLDRSLERVVVAHRTSEQELDLLVLLEDLAPAAERERPLPPPAEPLLPGMGEPNGAEVLTAISEWLNADIKPLVSGRDKFVLAVARNALGIVAREIEQRPVATDAALAAELLSGQAGLATPGMLARLRRMALAKLTADMPKYPALALARARWEGN